MPRARTEAVTASGSSRPQVFHPRWRRGRVLRHAPGVGSDGVGTLLAGPGSGEPREAPEGAALDESLREAENRALDGKRGRELRQRDLSLVGLGRLLVGEPAPDEVERLLRKQAGDEARADADRCEHDAACVHGPSLLGYLVPPVRLITWRLPVHSPWTRAPPTSRFSGVNLLAMNVAPCGSASTVMRTHGASNGGTTTLPPSSVALAAAVSASSTANVTLQCAGVSGGSSRIGLIVAMTSSKPSCAP